MEIDVDNITDPAQGIPTTSSQPTDCDNNVTSKAQTSTNDSLGNSNLSSSSSEDTPTNVISTSTEGEPTQFNEFQYWRPPLPDIDVTLEDKGDKANITDEDQTTATTSEKPAEVTSENITDVTKTELYKQLENELTETVTQLEKCLNIKSDEKEDTNNSASVAGEGRTVGEEGTSVDPEPESSEDKDGIKLHSAEVLTAEEEVPEEEVANIGSMHVLGHQVHQKTMAIVDGVVQGKAGIEDMYEFIEILNTAFF